MARQHATRRGIRDNFSGPGLVWLGAARLGVAGQGNTSLGTVTQTIFLGLAWRGPAGHGGARHGEAWIGNNAFRCAVTPGNFHKWKHKT